MILSKEEKFQEDILKKLGEHEIYPFSTIFTYEGGDPGGLLSITFYLEQDLDEVLNLLEYSTQCDKSGYTIFRESNTLILTGIALIQLYTKI